MRLSIITVPFYRATLLTLPSPPLPVLAGSNRWSLDGSGGSSYCECDLPAHRCRVRADALRSFALAADGPLAERPFTATCSSRTLWASPPDWLPEGVKVRCLSLLSIG